MRFNILRTRYTRLKIPEPTVQPAIDNPTADTPKRVLGFRDLVLFYAVTGISLRWIATAAAGVRRRSGPDQCGLQYLDARK